MRSIFNTFSQKNKINMEAIRLAEIVDSITNDLMNQHRDKIFELYNAENSKIAIKNMIIEMINSSRRGLQNESDTLVELVIQKIYDYYPVQHLMDEEYVTDIIISSPNDIQYKKKGVLNKAKDVAFTSPEALDRFVRKCVWKNGGDITRQKPYYLGSDTTHRIRISASLPPFSIDNATIHFRLHKLQNTSLAEMQGVHDMMDLSVLEFIESAIMARFKILVVGRPGSGKTTLSRAIINEIDSSIPTVSVEECPEWYITKENHRPFTLLQRNNELEKASAYDMSTLSGIVRYLLVAGTNCICIGEIKGPEAFDILHAYMTGNFGVNTLHVEDVDETHTRFAFMSKGNPLSSNYTTDKLEEMFSKSFDLIIYMDDFRVKSICELTCNKGVEYNHIFDYIDVGNSGYYRFNGLSDTLKEKFEKKGVDL